MSTERDPELGRALDLALPSPNAPYGAKLRLRRKLDERLAKPHPGSSTLVLAVVALAGVAALFFGLGAATSRDAANERSVLMLRSARVLLRDDAVLTVERDDATGSVLRLSSGKLLLHVRKGTGKSFEVVAGATRVSVVGTVFGVAVDARGAAAVQVVEGVVEVHHAGQTERLEAGETWPALWRLFGDRRELEVIRAPLPAPTADLVAPALPATEPAPEIRSRAAEEGIPNAGPRAGPTASVERSASPVPSGAPESAYSRARGLERSGDADGALAAYQGIVDARGENLEDALFALGRLRAQRGDQSGALSLAERYRSEFSNGRYARDVDVVVLNAELALGKQAGALLEATRFLASYPNDSRAWRFRLVRAADRAQKGDCDGARADVDSAPDGAAKRSVLEGCPTQ